MKSLMSILIMGIIVWQGEIYNSQSTWSGLHYRLVDQGIGTNMVVEEEATATDSQGVQTKSWIRTDEWFEAYVYSYAIRDLLKKNER